MLRTRGIAFVVPHSRDVLSCRVYVVPYSACTFSRFSLPKLLSLPLSNLGTTWTRPKGCLAYLLIAKSFWSSAKDCQQNMSTAERVSTSDGLPADASVHKAHHEPVTTAQGGTVLTSEADAELLAKMGYKQELKRNFSTLEVFGIAFSIMGLLPSISSTLSFSLPAGPAGMVWSWFIASGCIFVVGLAMADLGSAMPTSGGLYYWTHYFSSPKTRNYLSFLVGYSNSLGLIGGFCSINCE